MSLKFIFLGGSSFLGLQLMTALVKEGHEVATIVRSEEAKNKVLTNLPGCRIYNPEDSISNDYDFLCNLIVDYGRANKPFAQVYYANVTVPLNYLEGVKFKHLINFSTGLPNDLSHYAYSKRSLEEALSYLADKKSFKLINLRIQQFFGPYAPDENFVTYIIKGMLANKEIKLTDCEQQRDFIYVPELISGVRRIIEKASDLADVSIIELGSGKPRKLKEIVEFVAQNITSRSVINYGAVPKRENEPSTLFANLTEMSKLGWVPKAEFFQSLLETIAHYRSVK